MSKTKMTRMSDLMNQEALDKTHEACGKFWGNHHWSGTLAEGVAICPEQAELAVDLDALGLTGALKKEAGLKDA